QGCGASGGTLRNMTTVGFVGSGQIGGAIAPLAVEAGHQVVLSNSRGPETLADTAAELGPRASAATSGEAAAAGDIVVVTVPVKAFPHSPAAPLAGKTVIDTCNYGPERDGRIPDLDSKSLTSSELLLRYIPDAMLVKAFDNIFFKHLLSLARPAGGRPLLPADRRRLRAGEGGGDRVHRIPQVQRGRRGTAGRQLAAGDGHAGMGDPVRAVLRREGPAGRRGRHPRGTGHRNAVTASRRGPRYGPTAGAKSPFAQTGSSVMLRAKSRFPTPWLARPTVPTPAPSSQCAIFRPPTSSGRSPRLSMNASTLALACALSPAMKTSGRPFSRT